MHISNSAENGMKIGDSGLSLICKCKIKRLLGIYMIIWIALFGEPDCLFPNTTAKCNLYVLIPSTSNLKQFSGK